MNDEDKPRRWRVKESIFSAWRDLAGNILPARSSTSSFVAAFRLLNWFSVMSKVPPRLALAISRAHPTKHEAASAADVPEQEAGNDTLASMSPLKLLIVVYAALWTHSATRIG